MEGQYGWRLVTGGRLAREVCRDQLICNFSLDFEFCPKNSREPLKGFKLEHFHLWKITLVAAGEQDGGKDADMDGEKDAGMDAGPGSGCPLEVQ